MANFHIAIVRPEGYIHSSCFREVAEGLRAGLRSLGHGAEIGENTLNSLATNIFFGAHLLNQEEAESLPSSTIVYNLEQLGSAPLPPWYTGLAARLRVWDYSPLNMAVWRQLPCLEPPVLVEIGFAPVLRSIAPAPVQDIDVLFYGSVTERRRQILQQLQDAGANVHAIFGVYGKERDGYIARAKIVLNLHAYDTEHFEIVRVSYLLSNAKAVVCESSPDFGSLAHAVASFAYDGIVEGCLALLRNDAERRSLEARGYRLFSSRSQAQILEPIVGAALAGAPRGGPSASVDVRSLYLDLLQRCLINTIYEDPSYDPWSPHTFNSDLRDAGRDWPAQAHSMIGNRRMTNLRQIAEVVLQNDVPGDFIETGVWRGGACILMRAVLKAYGDTSRRVWVADSFCGLPAPNPSLTEDFGDQHYTFAELAISSDQVRANFSKYDLLDDQVCFLEGWFSDTLPPAPIERLAILRLDGDMYESTMDALNALYHKVSPGGFVIVDDFGAVAGCKRAILEFRQRHGIDDPLRDIDGIGAFWCKSAAAVQGQQPSRELSAVG